MLSDEKIIELFLHRDEKALDECQTKYGDYLYRVASNILCDSEDARECVNDTYLDAWNVIPPHRPSSLATFLGKITRRIAIDRYRRNTAKKRGGSEVDAVLSELDWCIGEDSTERHFERKELAELLCRFVRSLPRLEREVFLLRYWYAEPTESISRRLNVSKSNVTTLLYRTRNKLRECLKKEEMI